MLSSTYVQGNVSIPLFAYIASRIHNSRSPIVDRLFSVSGRCM